MTIRVNLKSGAIVVAILAMIVAGSACASTQLTQDVQSSIIVGDGKADFIVGAPYADPGGRADAGSAYVFSGADGSLLYQKDGGAAGDNFGLSVSAAGDGNGDGKADFIVGANGADPGGRADAGSAYVYSGADGSLLYQKDGVATEDRFGLSVGGAK